MMTCHCGLRALAASLAVSLPPKFRGLCPAICAFLAPLWELKAGAESGTQNCASESKILALRTPFLAAIFDPLSGAGKIEKSRAETRAKFWLHIELRHTELRAQLLPTGRRNFLLYVIVASYKNLISAGCQRQYLLGRQHGKFPVALYKPYIVGIHGLQSPRIPREHNKYHGYTVRSTSNCPLTISIFISSSSLQSATKRRAEPTNSSTDMAGP